VSVEDRQKGKKKKLLISINESASAVGAESKRVFFRAETLF